MISKKLIQNSILVSVVAFATMIMVFLLVFYGSKSINGITSYFEKQQPSVQGILLFYGDGCNQCAKVDTYIKNNKVEESVPFTKLEVFNNATNANMLADKAQICGLGPEKVGVPLLWDEKTCIVGYADVINFFKAKLAVKKP